MTFLYAWLPTTLLPRQYKQEKIPLIAMRRYSGYRRGKRIGGYYSFSFNSWCPVSNGSRWIDYKVD